MVTRAEGEAARDEEGFSLGRGALFLEALLVPVNTKHAANAERGGLSRSGRSPLGGIKRADRAAEGLLDLLGRGRVGVEIESDRAGGREFSNDQILLPGKPEPLNPSILPFYRGDARPEMGGHEMKKGEVRRMNDGRGCMKPQFLKSELNSGLYPLLTISNIPLFHFLPFFPDSSCS